MFASYILLSSQLDCSGFVVLGARHIQSQDPVEAFRFHLVCIDLDGETFECVRLNAHSCP
jgi:hypothetical protein